MSSESFTKDLFRTFVKIVCKVVAIGVGIVLLICGLASLFSNAGNVPHHTTPRVLANDQWKIRPFSADAPTILHINITGTIGMYGLRKEKVFTQLLESVDIALKPGQVKAILMTINSPGGVASDADSIYRYLQEYKKRYKVPVYAYVNGLCASGGMYIACAADKIYASEDSLIGHVGTLLSPPFFNVSALMQQWGIQSKTIFAGKDKDSMNPFRPWHENEGEAFQYIVDSAYDLFLTVVSQNRPKLTKEVLIDQGARIWPTKDALEYGYIDSPASTIDDVLRLLAKEAGIEDFYQFVELDSHDFFESLLGPRPEGIFKGILSGKIEHHVRVPGDLPSELIGKPLYLYHP